MYRFILLLHQPLCLSMPKTTLFWLLQFLLGVKIGKRYPVLFFFFKTGSAANVLFEISPDHLFHFWRVTKKKKKGCCDFNWDCISIDHNGEYLQLLTLNILVHEHGISLHLLTSYLIYFTSLRFIHCLSLTFSKLNLFLGILWFLLLLKMQLLPSFISLLIISIWKYYWCYHLSHIMQIYWIPIVLLVVFMDFKEYICMSVYNLAICE